MFNMPNLPIAALSATADPAMSARYVHIDTREVVRLMDLEGWKVASAKTASPRKKDPLYAKHMIDFRREDSDAVMKSTGVGVVPRVLFVNSHNGTSSANARGGFYRFVCSNGLVIGHDIAKYSARHLARDAHEFVHDMQKIAKSVDAKLATYTNWSELQMDAPRRAEYARLAGQLRWGDAWAYSTEELLSPRREEDDDGSLLTVFNRVQENATRGGLAGVSRNGRRTVSQPLADITRDLNFNAALWKMTEEFAEHVL